MVCAQLRIGGNNGKCYLIGSECPKQWCLVMLFSSRKVLSWSPPGPLPSFPHNHSFIPGYSSTEPTRLTQKKTNSFLFICSQWQNCRVPFVLLGRRERPTWLLLECQHPIIHQNRVLSNMLNRRLQWCCTIRTDRLTGCHSSGHCENLNFVNCCTRQNAVN